MKSQAYFEKIHKQIEYRLIKSEHNIKLAVAWLTDQKLFDILCKKALEGLDVQLIIAYQEINLESNINFDKLISSGGKIYWIGNGYKYEALMHNKFCIIDNYTLITGSYNWTQKAKSNHESITVIEDDSNLIFEFSQEFDRILKKYNKTSDLDSKTDWNIISIRLQTLLSLIKLEDEEDVLFQIKKLKNLINTDEKDLNTNKIKEIISNCEKKLFYSSVVLIEEFLKQFSQVKIYQNPEVSALKLEVKILENQINAFDNEKIELEKILNDFQHRHTIELGDIILEVLNYTKILYKDDYKKKKEVEEDYKKYNEQFEIEKSKPQFDLTEEERIELKKNFRKATMLCHPDKVNEEQKAEAEKVFIELKEAQERNDLLTVNRILYDLENGKIFSSQSEKISEIETLKILAEKLRLKLIQLETEINEIKESDTFNIIIKITDWDSYFVEKKIQLLKQLEDVKLQIIQKA